MHVCPDRESQGLSRRHRPLGKVGCEAQSLPIMAGARRSRQLRSLRRHRLQLKGTFSAQQHAYQSRTQQQAKPVGQCLDNGAHIRASM